MFRICLIQNRNEMLHYDFADNRKLLDEMGFEYKLYTSNNISSLVPDIESNDFDTIVISTNALSDNFIKNVIYSDEFRLVLESHLDKHRGLLVFSQLKMSEEIEIYNFIPEKFGTVTPIKRNDDSNLGELFVEPFYESNSLFIFPNEIDIKRIDYNSKVSKNIEGLYWHYHQVDQRSLWESLVIDKNNNNSLLIKSKTANIFCCSIMLDWQKHHELFFNMIISSVANEEYIGIIATDAEEDISFKYLLKALELNKIYFKTYLLDKHKSVLKKNINNNVHSYIILSPKVSYGDLPHDMCEMCDSIDLKIIDMKGREVANNFSLYGSSNSMSKYIQDIEYFIQKELHENHKGYIENSFWKTIEVVQVLFRLQKDFSKRYNRRSLKKTLEYVKSKDKNGSYDETFGATCAKLWLITNCQGCEDNQLSETKSWIFQKINNVSSFDFITGCIYLKMCGFELNEFLTEKLQSEIDFILGDSPNEISLLNVIIVADLYKLEAVLEDSINQILDRSRDYIWIDYSTSATITLGLMNVYNNGYKDILSKQLWDRFEKHIFASTHLLRKNIFYTFGSKNNFDIVTIAKSIAVCTLFEDIIDFPTDEILSLVKSSFFSLRQSSINNNTSNLLEELRIENSERTDLIKNQKNSLAKVLKKENLYKYHLFSSIFIYFIFILAMVFIIDEVGFGIFVTQIFTDYVAFTLSSLIPLAALGYNVYKHIVKKNKE